ncbi:MAG: GAK system CofD-like protein [Desulfomicrobiaceae bacterium]|nr:GAK system CofD-like protein [Desulfomicrobiaceae bacterium]
MTEVTLFRRVVVPDPARVALCRRSPELGPRILFFSGGTALRETSQALIEYTHNSIHLITPFDSGGSSAILRRYFGMPAVGDLRNRLMALADRSLHGYPEIYELFAHRLPKTAPDHELWGTLNALADGTHPLIRQVQNPMRRIIRRHLRAFAARVDSCFDLRGASIGNLILASGYLEDGRHMDPIVYLYSRLIQARGEVRLIANVDGHLRAQLQNGRTVLGQHQLTGKEAAPLESPIENLELVDANGHPMEVALRSKITRLITGADLICYPIGSFYTSVLANLLPQGVGNTIAAAGCPKIFTPNPGPDPETVGLTLRDQIQTLLRYACPPGAAPTQVLNFVLLDPAGTYAGRTEAIELCRSFSIDVLEIPFLTHKRRADPHRLCHIFVSLAR